MSTASPSGGDAASDLPAEFPPPPAADDGVFVRVECPECEAPEVYLKCDQCGRQALFALSARGVTCRCGAQYSHASCSCGAQVAPTHLVAVPFDEGPLVASEMEVDPVRAAVAVLALLAIAAGGIAALIWGLG